MIKGQKHSLESRKKLSISHQGKIPWNKGKKGIMPEPWNKGKIIDLNLYPNYGMKNKKQTSKAKILLGERAKNNKYHFEKKHSEKTKKRISELNKGKHFSLKTEFKKGEFIKEKHLRWKGGYQNKLWHNRQRRIKRMGNGGFHSQGEWENLKAQYNWTCLHCNKQEPIITLSVDHIIPLSKGGSDNIENIQPLCRSCNSKKHDRLKYIGANEI